MNPITLLEQHAQEAKNEVDRLDVELEVTREKWKREEAAYSKMVEERKKHVAEYEGFQRVLLALERASLEGRRL